MPTSTTPQSSGTRSNMAPSRDDFINLPLSPPMLFVWVFGNWGHSSFPQVFLSERSLSFSVAAVFRLFPY